MSLQIDPKYEHFAYNGYEPSIFTNIYRAIKYTRPRKEEKRSNSTNRITVEPLVLLVFLAMSSGSACEPTLMRLKCMRWYEDQANVTWQRKEFEDFIQVLFIPAKVSHGNRTGKSGYVADAEVRDGDSHHYAHRHNHRRAGGSLRTDSFHLRRAHVTHSAEFRFTISVQQTCALCSIVVVECFFLYHMQIHKRGLLMAVTSLFQTLYNHSCLNKRKAIEPIVCTFAYARSCLSEGIVSVITLSSQLQTDLPLIMISIFYAMTGLVGGSTQAFVAMQSFIVDIVPNQHRRSTLLAFLVALKMIGEISGSSIAGALIPRVGIARWLALSHTPLSLAILWAIVRIPMIPPGRITALTDGEKKVRVSCRKDLKEMFHNFSLHQSHCGLDLLALGKLVPFCATRIRKCIESLQDLALGIEES